ncbi:MAG: diaminopimelate decarboxylase [Gemmatimonadaceae bacterium]|nr:diaminopimelate decarboxylase [Gemmatimonadaceae bacterium]MDQ3519559.1 diaminopimelate decarboxylase [Gemmatimonadota bacterium]
MSSSDSAAGISAVTLETIAAEVGTPTYVYNAAAVRGQYGSLISSLQAVPHRIHYSMKANSSHAILSLLRELGAGVDIVSGGELFRALRAGFRGRDIVFSGVGKTRTELREALTAGILMVNVEGEGELYLLNEIAGELGLVAPIALRVNPEVTVDTPHPYTRTGERGLKFGIAYDEAIPVGRLALSLPNIRLRGLDMHIGSQVSSLEPYRAGTERLLQLYEKLRLEGANDIAYLDIGGGLAVTYDDEKATDVEAFAAAIHGVIQNVPLTLILEPGRFLVGNAGLLLTRVLYRKRSGGREYIITDAGMNDLLRPSHYNAYHHIESVRPTGVRGVFDVVGPVCESGDFFALGRSMDAAEPDDLLTIRSAGAYGFCMSSTYNSRPRAAEVIVDGDRWAVATEREEYADLTGHELTELAWRDV